MYKTNIKTKMLIDHKNETTYLKDLSIDVNGYENRELEREALDSYNSNKKISRYIDRTKLLWNRVFANVYSRLRYWPLMMRKKREI